jgi:hypothetical protein
MVTLEIVGTNVEERGRGFWKLNSALLGDPEYVKKINEVIAESISENKNCSNK